MKFDLLTIAEAAERARIGRRTLDRAIALGVGPAVTAIGRRKFLRTDMLQAWLESRTGQPHPDQAHAA